jgi:hypothetical protein
MNAIILLEKLANNAHHRIETEQMLESESAEIRLAFTTNNPTLLKNQFNDNTPITAHRSSITQLKQN